MASFNSYEDLMQAVEERRQDTLTLEVDMGGKYSQEHEDAKTELKQAKALKMLTGDQQFLSGANLDELEQRVADTRPEERNIWIRFNKLSLAEWAILIKKQGMTPLDQYETVLPKTFVGIYGEDPDLDGVTPLSEDPALLSSKGGRGILPGGALHSVVQSFMTWQNSGGEVSIRPMKSGRA